MTAVDAAALGFDLVPFPVDLGNHVADAGAGIDGDGDAAIFISAASFGSANLHGFHEALGR